MERAVGALQKISLISIPTATAIIFSEPLKCMDSILTTITLRITL